MPRTLSEISLKRFIEERRHLSSAIKWQNQPASTTNAYQPPQESNKVTYSKWTAKQHDDLEQAFVAAQEWLEQGRQPGPVKLPSVLFRGLTDEPVNVNPNVGNDGDTVMQGVSPEYMWKLYVAHVAFALAAESLQRFPWSIETYTPAELRYLFDSTTMAWNIFGSYYEMGTYSIYVPALRADNLPKTAFASPAWVFSFLMKNHLIGRTVKDTICRVLDWMRHNMVHFYGQDTFGNCYAVWQYRGYPPLSRIVDGTTDSNNPTQGVCHYTAGCHGSVGFLHAVLRVLNIPVQPVWVAGHELAYFMTEKLYLDHGDDPYNQNVKNSSQPIAHVLIDEATYQARFTSNLLINITDLASPAQANIGLAAAQFPQP